MTRARPGIFALAALAALALAECGLAQGDPKKLPRTAEGFKASLVATEPDLLHPSALVFDAKGRLFVGGGPQFRNPTPTTPPDSIKILVDEDGDGVAEKVKTFANGFNSIQALAWKGKDLWVANSPDVTIVRDLDGDDVADEYIRVFTGVRHCRHALDGFNWAPDGKLYMSQGNSTVEPHAPKVWRDLMNIRSDHPDVQPVQSFKPGEYKHAWVGERGQSEAGVIRCDDLGKNAEIYARGMRNPWDICHDDGFKWFGTDNADGGEHDRMFMPFFGAHFGKAHPWSASWTGDYHLPTAPASGLFPESGGSGVLARFVEVEGLEEFLEGGVGV